MKKHSTRKIIGAALVIITIFAVLASVTWALIFKLMNPDMTELRLFIENPYPTIVTSISLLVFLIGKALMGDD